MDRSSPPGHPLVYQGQGQRVLLQGAQYAVLSPHLPHRYNGEVLFPEFPKLYCRNDAVPKRGAVSFSFCGRDWTLI